MLSDVVSVTKIERLALLFRRMVLQVGSREEDWDELVVASRFKVVLHDSVVGAPSVVRRFSLVVSARSVEHAGSARSTSSCTSVVDNNNAKLDACKVLLQHPLLAYCVG